MSVQNESFDLFSLVTQLAVPNHCGVPALPSPHVRKRPRLHANCRQQRGVVSTMSTLSGRCFGDDSISLGWSKCQPTQRPLSVRSPTKYGDRTMLHRRAPCGRIIHRRSKRAGKCFVVPRKARRSMVFQLFFCWVLRMWHLMVWQECFVTILGVNLWKPRGPRTIRRCAHAVR